MRSGRDREDGDMTDDEHHGHVYASAAATTPGRKVRHTQVVIGVSGALAVLAGAYLITTQVMETSQKTLPEPAALAPLTTPVTPGIDGTGVSPVPGHLRASRTTHPAQIARRAPSPTPDDLGSSLIPAPLETVAAAPHAMVTRRVETLRNGTIRVSSARFDLSGQSDLRLAADAGYPVGDGVHCTSRVRFAADDPAAARDDLLLCWRTSDDRSVVTMAIATQGSPDPRDSVAVIEQEWATLG
ncbi:hypothetical protein [Actinoplanes sp. NPDC020271]|uniref:hypothetical protein n=1 Tax=Actinoplanes sp. NPDC020271 TaxID=3363896 RepID=UPI00379BE920